MPAALKDWRGMTQVLAFFEGHSEWRALRSYGKLAIVQDPTDALLSGGILDMIGAQHTPSRAIPGQRLTAESLQGATMAVNVDAEALTAEQREMLKISPARAAPCSPPRPDGKASRARVRSDHLGQGRDRPAERHLARRANHDRPQEPWCAAVQRLSHALECAPDEDGKQVVVELVNYSAYPIDDITVQVLGNV